MPRSKRVRVEHLTRSKPKGRSHKETLIETIREALKEYPHLYTFDYTNLRASFLKQIRLERQADSRMFMGSNRVMAVALGRNEEESVAPNIYKLVRFLKGSVGLLFTRLSKNEIKTFFHETFVREDFARTGALATHDFVIPSGSLSTETFPHNMSEQLAHLGLPVKLDHGVIHVREDTPVCTKGCALTSNAAQLLKLWGIRMCTFRITLTAHWTNGVARQIVAPSVHS